MQLKFIQLCVLLFCNTIIHAQIQTTSPKKITNIYPAFSKQGDKIAFISNRDGNPEIYIMNADGSNQTRVTNDPAKDVSPEWSPDGKQIAYISSKDTSSDDVYIINLQTKETKRITQGMKINRPKIAWSPDGKWIAFSSRNNNVISPFIVSVSDTKVVKQLITDTTSSNYHMSWLPDSKRIIFHSNRAGKKVGLQLYTLDITTGAVTKVLNRELEFDNYIPSISPDGKKIAFVTSIHMTETDKNNWEIYTANIDGSDIRRISNNTGYDFWCSIAPDGKSVAVQSRRGDDSNMQIRLIKEDGTELQLTQPY